VGDARGECDGLRAVIDAARAPVLLRGGFDMQRSELRRVASRAVVAAALFGGAFLAGGCRGVEKIEIPNIFRVTPERPLADVPVPDGFRYKDLGSYIFDRNYRVARLRYSGTPHLEETVGFFKEQMPLSRWMFVREEGNDARALFFRNEIEEMKVSVERQGGITSIEIDISPRKM